MIQHPPIGTDDWFAQFGAEITTARQYVAERRPVYVTWTDDEGTGWAVAFEGSNDFWADFFVVTILGNEEAKQQAEALARAWNAQCQSAQPQILATSIAQTN